LRTKQTFLERLLELSQDEWTALPVQWSPADIRSFEQDAVEPLKADLKRTKQQQQDLKQEVQAVAERIGAKHRQLERLAHARTTQLERIQGKQRELAELRAAFTGEAPPEASVAELADALGNLQAQVTKVRVDLQARQTAVQELGRLHLLCEEECQRQRDSLQVLEAECQALETRARGRPNLAALLQWHRLMLSLTQAAMPFVVRVDTVRSDYLLVTLGNGAELHVGLDAATGRLVSVRGLNDAALVARAIEYNDLGHLLRSLSASS
jgi:chromosome segregation ATPase